MTANCQSCQRNYVCTDLHKQSQQEAGYDCDQYLWNSESCTLTPRDANCGDCMFMSQCWKRKSVK